MKNARSVLLLLAIITIQVVSASAQSVKAEIKRIDAYCKAIDALTKKAKKPQLVFADTSDYTDADAKPKWQNFVSERALEKFRESTETYSIAFVWKRTGYLVSANFTDFSPSGDWSKYVNHYFRSDGTLAKVKVDYRTFYGDFAVKQDRYYSAKGKLIKTTTTYNDLDGKPKKPDPEYLSANSQLLSGDIYTVVGKLPFAKLLNKK